MRLDRTIASWLEDEAAFHLENASLVLAMVTEGLGAIAAGPTSRTSA